MFDGTYSFPVTIYATHKTAITNLKSSTGNYGAKGPELLPHACLYLNDKVDVHGMSNIKHDCIWRRPSVTFDGFDKIGTPDNGRLQAETCWVF
jgi:hypothetical protein